MFLRLLVRIPAPYTGFIFHIYLLYKIVMMFVWKDEKMKTRQWLAHFFQKEIILFVIGRRAILSLFLFIFGLSKQFKS